LCCARGDKNMQEVKIEKVDNGYIVKELNFTGKTKVFSCFADVMDYLFDFFNEKHEKR
jgi:hypothetical protein